MSCKPHDAHPLAGLAKMAHRCDVFDMNSCKPTMPKMKNAKNTRIKTSRSIGRDRSRVTTSCRMPLTPVIVRSGRNIRTVLIPEKFPMPGRYANSPSTTTKKSILFQGSLR